jgi:hypothetical protein
MTGPAQPAPRVLSAAIKRAKANLKESGVPLLPESLTPHSLRRTFASVLYALGEDPGVVIDEMGIPITQSEQLPVQASYGRLPAGAILPAQAERTATRRREQSEGHGEGAIGVRPLAWRCSSRWLRQLEPMCADPIAHWRHGAARGAGAGETECGDVDRDEPHRRRGICAR